MGACGVRPAEIARAIDGSDCSAPGLALIPRHRPCVPEVYGAAILWRKSPMQIKGSYMYKGGRPTAERRGAGGHDPGRSANSPIRLLAPA